MIVRDFLEKWRFGFLLLAVLCALVIEPLVFGPRAGRWIFDIVYSFILVSAAYAISERKRHRLAFSVFAALALSA